MPSISEQVINRTRSIVMGQLGRIFPANMFPDQLRQKMVGVYDAGLIPPTEVEQLMQGKRIISDAVLLSLAEEITLEILFHEDAWMERVADHIVLHAFDCDNLYHRMVELASTR